MEGLHEGLQEDVFYVTLYKSNMGDKKTSKNIKKHQKTSKNIKKHQKTSKNIKKTSNKLFV
jgi:hypothetical protein